MNYENISLHRYWIYVPTACLALAACTASALQPATHQDGADNSTANTLTQTPRTVQYLALGDSYTIGEQVDVSDRWPIQLTRLLYQEGFIVTEPEIIAQTGWTTGDLAAGILYAELQPTYDLVSLLIGVNNQYLGYDPEEYRRELGGLLKQAVNLTGNRPERVFVLSIPDWSVTPFAEGRDRSKIAAEIDLFNRINQQESVRSGVSYIDITVISRLAQDDKTLLARDGLHPSGLMYAVWARLALPVVIQALGKENKQEQDYIDEHDRK